MTADLFVRLEEAAGAPLLALPRTQAGAEWQPEWEAEAEKPPLAPRPEEAEAVVGRREGLAAVHSQTPDSST
ncbi:MAG TPA: hypothetical protein VFB27_00540 [Opitutaceae bacterium]|nr:hypothetical protein [Opitutaceae bacterium]